jgi:integrase
MAIERLPEPKKGRDGKLYNYRVRFRPKAGRKGRIEYFETKPKAKAWQEDQYSEARKTRKGLHSIQDWRNHKVSDIVRSYLSNRVYLEDRDLTRKELEEENTRPYNVFTVLWDFSCRPIADRDLFEFNERVAEKYIEDRLREAKKVHNSKTEQGTISPTSVGWEVMKIQKVWEWARQSYPDLIDLDNPWKKANNKPRSTGIPRDRELVGDEEDRLLKACKACLGRNRYYLPLGIMLAAETGMRRQEFMNLDWEDIDFKGRRITIRKSKTDNNRLKIVLPVKAYFALLDLAACTNQPTGKIFVSREINRASRRISEKPMTGEAFSDAFDKVVRRAKIEDLVLRDLRQTATTLFIKADLLPEERQVMKREKNKTMDARHYQGRVSRSLHLETIQEKLDRYALRGKTLDELNEAEKRLARDRAWGKLLGFGGKLRLPKLLAS